MLDSAMRNIKNRVDDNLERLEEGDFTVDHRPLLEQNDSEGDYFEDTSDSDASDDDS